MCNNIIIIINGTLLIIRELASASLSHTSNNRL